MKLKKLLFIPMLFIIFVFFFAGGIYIWWSDNSKPVSTDTTKVRFVISEGQSATQVGNMLYKRGLIKSPLAFKGYVQVADKADKLQIGEFNLSPNMSLTDVVGRLTKNPDEYWVRIVEGLRKEQIPEKFTSSLEMDSVASQKFRQEFLSESKDLEGMLFPESYLFPRDISGKLAVARMKSTFDKRIDEFKKDIAASRLSLKEIVVLASIIERETKKDEERPIVAGILLNRLRIGMGLQADATVQYAVASAKCQKDNVVCDNWWPILTRDDLEIDSPFNTYKYTGFPPSPIANPGVLSLKAAIMPEDSDYLYYVHDSEGNIHYAKTLSEHNENVHKYLGK